MIRLIDKCFRLPALFEQVFVRVKKLLVTNENKVIRCSLYE